MFSKRLKLIASLVLLLFLVACGGSDDDDGGVFGAGGSGGGTGSGSAGAGETTDGSAERGLAIGSGEGDNFQEAVIGASTTNLSADGSTQLYFNVIDRNNSNSLMEGEPQPIEVSSPCLEGGVASITPKELTTSDGTVEFTYTAGDGCTGTDVVTARLSNGGSATVELVIGSADGVTILAGLPAPMSIAPMGYGSDARKNTSTVPFTIEDSAGATISGHTVSFRLYPESAGAGDPSLESTTANSTDGTYIATVEAGTENRVVRVVASVEIDGKTLETTSSPIAINTHLPTEEAFTISLDNFAPNARQYAGVTVGVTIHAADKNGVMVRDGLINFTTDGGAIEGDCELNDAGTCTVEWRSQNPVPPNGITTITASTIGTTCPHADDSCVPTPERIGRAAQLVMASDRGIAINLTGGGGEYCASASATAGGGNTTALPSGTEFAFTAEQEDADTIEITSDPATFTVENVFNGTGVSDDDYCVSVTGTGRLKVTVTPPAPYSGSGEQAALDII